MLAEACFSAEWAKYPILSLCISLPIRQTGAHRIFKSDY